MDKATWIWFPGDYEIWLGNKTNNKRSERGTFFPPFWKTDSHYVTVEFSTPVDLAQAETIEIRAEGRYNVKLDGAFIFGMPARVEVPAGRHEINIKVHSLAVPPALYVCGPTIKSGAEWKVTPEDLEWIDDSGKASDKSATVYSLTGSGDFCSPDSKPSEFRLDTTQMQAASYEQVCGGVLYDFGEESFGYLRLHGLGGSGNIDIFYGESREEACDETWCETLDKLSMQAEEVMDMSTGQILPVKDGICTMDSSKALRFVLIKTSADASVASVDLLTEYLPVQCRGSFSCNDSLINRIWEVGRRTLHLTEREVFIDGIKRDRWAWSGDAVQSYLMDYYSFFNSAGVKRTSWLLRGKDPVTTHINTIMDYSFFWFIGISDYYLYTGDKQFVKAIFPRMKSLMEWICSRTDKNGLAVWRPGDWVFVDWADGPMSKTGELCFEQVLFAKSLESLSACAEIAGDPCTATSARIRFKQVRSSIDKFWDEERQALVHNIEDGRQSSLITRYANMFAIFYGYLAPERMRKIKDSVLLNDKIMSITTPYMRFYELEALCALGEQESVLDEIRSYWGGMLELGATTFWEKYDPSETGAQHLAMYGKPYRKSLCHAWGASPVYLLGRYFAGVRPTAPAYSAFELRPVLGGLEWFDCKVPTPSGEISIRMDKSSITVHSPSGKGQLIFRSSSAPVCKTAPIEALPDMMYRISFQGDASIEAQYTV